MKTNLDDIFDDVSSEEGIVLDKDNVHQTIFDLYLPEEDRLRAIEKYHDYEIK